MRFVFKTKLPFPWHTLGAMSVVLAVAGCASSGTEAPRDPLVVRTFSAPLNQTLRVETGDALFVSGAYIDGEEIALPKTVEIMVPGSMFIPFPVRMDAGVLTMRSIHGGHKYYCAAEGRAAASFPGLGSVIRSGDCVGIRFPVAGGEPQWVVDNSNYNRMSTIWTRNMTAEERAAVQVRTAAEPFAVKDMTRILFDGYHGQKLHFTLTEWRDGRQSSRQFIFDFNGQPTLVGIRGNQWRVLSADNLALSYQWVKIANP